MPLVGLEPTIPAFERAKTVHALDRAATVIGDKSHAYKNNFVYIEGYDLRDYSIGKMTA
jgi:hypothetical protein